MIEEFLLRSAIQNGKYIFQLDCLDIIATNMDQWQYNFILVYESWMYQNRITLNETITTPTPQQNLTLNLHTNS